MRAMSETAPRGLCGQGSARRIRWRAAACKVTCTQPGNLRKDTPLTAPAALRPTPDHHLGRAVGRRLRDARKRAGLTLVAAGRHLGRDHGTVARYERGEVDPPTSVLVALAGLYRVHPGELFPPAPQA
jgi:ribosome-binding protein aMBF1 (putative translation factor)